MVIAQVELIDEGHLPDARFECGDGARERSNFRQWWRRFASRGGQARLGFLKFAAQGARSAMRRASAPCSERTTSIFVGTPSRLKPARTESSACSRWSWVLCRFGKARSSKNNSMNSSRVSLNVNSSSPAPSSPA